MSVKSKYHSLLLWFRHCWPHKSICVRVRLRANDVSSSIWTRSKQTKQLHERKTKIGWMIWFNSFILSIPLNCRKGVLKAEAKPRTQFYILEMYSQVATSNTSPLLKIFLDHNVDNLLFFPLINKITQKREWRLQEHRVRVANLCGFVAFVQDFWHRERSNEFNVTNSTETRVEYCRVWIYHEQHSNKSPFNKWSLGSKLLGSAEWKNRKKGILRKDNEKPPVR